MRALALIPFLAALLAGCIAPVAPGAPQAALTARPPIGAPLPGEMRFAEVAARVGPVAEALCRDRARTPRCNFQIVIDTSPTAPPNAFQTVDRAGRPVIGFTAALIADARNADEVAFVMGHEGAHHILGHIPQRQEQALSGAVLGGILASAAGVDAAGIAEAQRIGAELAARQFSKEFELEADGLGTEIALRAGFDAVRGSAFFDRLPDPGDQFLGSHPANADRKALVRAAQTRLLTGG